MGQWATAVQPVAAAPGAAAAGAAAAVHASPADPPRYAGAPGPRAGRPSLDDLPRCAVPLVGHLCGGVW
jgi:hypothetical protein